MERSAPILLLLLGVACTTLISCREGLLGSEPERAPDAVFDVLWNDFDRYYAHFVVKSVDWDTLYVRYHPRAARAASDQELFAVLCEMLLQLEDGHVDLLTPFQTCSYTDWYRKYPHRFSQPLVRIRYLDRGYAVTEDERLTSGLLSDTVAYVHIASFAGSNWIDAFEAALEPLSPFSALIVDVRDNGGGSSRNAEAVAGRLADQRRLFAYHRYRAGPKHTDFTEPSPFYVEPQGSFRFTGPIVVLTNRRCFSACEHFVLAMRVLPHVTVVGDTTGGGLGNPLYRELQNGWSYRLPVWLETTPDGEALEGEGIAPDVPVPFTPTDSLRGLDTIMEYALDLLSPARET